MSHTFFSAHLNFQSKYFSESLGMCFEENEVYFIHAWEICMYYMIDTERNIMLNNFMADMPKAIQMRELITMQAKEIPY